MSVTAERMGPREPAVHGPVTRTDFVRYQGASGDMNPIHHDEEFARAAGFPSPFSVGMFQAGLLATFATDWLGAANVRRYRARFKAQVWPGDTLTCSGAVVRAYEQDGEQRVDVDLSCVRQNGEVAVQAEATFVRPRTDPAPPPARPADRVDPVDPAAPVDPAVPVDSVVSVDSVEESRS
ncbi:MaoC/PaaZ C-terminal domain-containing protein [Streptomyces sp. NPDC026672]|uniref:MaoC/PaaZ C-terminal domain-containing protein n=1 Tax=unclassified Streptomyces TaxID=2593676 RepID=UPI0034019735